MDPVQVLTVHKRGCSNCGSFVGPYTFYGHSKIRLCPSCEAMAKYAWTRLSDINENLRKALEGGDTDRADRLREDERRVHREYYAAIKDFTGLKDEPVVMHVGESPIERAVTRDHLTAIADLKLRGWENTTTTDTMEYFVPPSRPCTSKRCPRCRN